MDEWIKCKEELPPNNTLVFAMNPHITSLSWLDGADELGKRSWCYEEWNHADQFVADWRYLTNEEVDIQVQKAQFDHPKWHLCKCQIKYRNEINE